MVIQYPYRLEMAIITESNKDDDGNYIASDLTWEYVTDCRDEAGNGKIIKDVDGVNYVCTAIIQCRSFFKKVDLGTLVRVVDNKGEVRVSNLPILNIHKGQLHTRIWV